MSISRLEPKEIKLDTSKGEKTFILHKFPAVVGREVILKYPTVNAPKLGEYEASQEIMLTLMKYVGVSVQGKTLYFETQVMVDNHVPDAETLLKLEYAMFEYNYSFFGRGKMSGFLEQVAEKLPALISKMLTILSEQSSEKEKQVSKN